MENGIKRYFTVEVALFFLFIISFITFYFLEQQIRERVSERERVFAFAFAFKQNNNNKKTERDF